MGKLVTLIENHRKRLSLMERAEIFMEAENNPLKNSAYTYAWKIKTQRKD